MLLDTVAHRGTGHTPSQKHADYWDGGVKWVSLTDSPALDRGYIFDSAKKISHAGLRHSSAVLHPKGTVILSRDAGVGKSAILGDSMAVSQHFIAWQCDRERLNEGYLYQWLQQQKGHFERIANGSTVKTIGFGFFTKLEIPLPPLATQQQIAMALARWDEAIAITERLVRTESTRHKGLVAGLYAASDRLGSANAFGDVLIESRNPAVASGLERKLTVRLYGKGVVAKTERYSGSANTQYHRRSSGQLIYSKLDFLNGAFGIVPTHLDGSNSTTDMPAFDISESVNPVWLLNYLTRPAYYTRQVGLARGQRKARRVNVGDFLKSTIVIPEVKVQSDIANALLASSDRISNYRLLVVAIKKQKRALMRKLMNGDWRFSTSEAGII